MPNPSLKLSPNGVAHWACGAGASPQFCAAVPARHTAGATLARTLGRTTDAPPSLQTYPLGNGTFAWSARDCVVFTPCRANRIHRLCVSYRRTPRWAMGLLATAKSPARHPLRGLGPLGHSGPGRLLDMGFSTSVAEAVDWQVVSRRLLASRHCCHGANCNRVDLVASANLSLVGAGSAGHCWWFARAVPPCAL
jgi:hypothetical protein